MNLTNGIDFQLGLVKTTKSQLIRKNPPHDTKRRVFIFAISNGWNT